MCHLENINNNFVKDLTLCQKDHLENIMLLTVYIKLFVFFLESINDFFVNDLTSCHKGSSRQVNVVNGLTLSLEYLL